MHVTTGTARAGRARTIEVRVHVGRQSVAVMAGSSRTHAAIGWDLSGHGGYRRWRTDRVAAGIAQARRHGHPSWSHVVAYGPCTRED